MLFRLFKLQGKFFLVDFDNTTGIISNPQILSSGGRVYGVSFSPDNSKLYCSANGIGELYQYNLNAGSLAAIIASKTFIVQNGPDSWRQHQLGPDGKIYVSRTLQPYLSVIESPDSLCPACIYNDLSLYLGGQNTSAGLPHFITSFNYSNDIVQCNTGIQQIDIAELLIKIFPNPVQESFTIELPQEEIYSFIISDMIGRKVYELKKVFGTISVDCRKFCNGIYFIKATSDKNMLSTKLIKQ